MRKFNYACTEGVELAWTASRSLRRSFLDQPSSKGKHKITDHQLKLDLSNRKLTDTGCQVVINTLLQCLQHRDETHPEGIVQIVHLIKISLKGNDLTAESLPKLAQVISLSTGYLEDLDLSDNQIEISNENEKENWRQFLGSFRNCFMLKRLNFGGNPLSTLAIEILAKTYIESPLYVGTDGGNDWSIYSPGSVRDRVHEKQMASQTGEMHESGKIKLAMEREHFRRQHGLRSVPYFILSNLELTRAAIVHLSSMVSAQMSRAYLRTFLPDTKPVVLTDEAARNCHSIIWLPNQSFDSRSRELLHCATAMVTLPPAMLQGNIRTLQTPRARSKSLVPKMRPHGAHGHLLKTVLSTALQEEGPGASDLWMTSCKMLKLRTLLLNEPSQVDILQPSDSPRGFIRGTPEFDRQFPPLVDDHPVSSFQALVNKPVWAFWRSDFCTLVRESEYWLRLPARKQLSILTHAVGALGVLTAEQQKQVAGYVGQWDVAWDEPLDKKQGQQLASFLYQVGCVYHRPQGQKMDVK